jgi:hypothetical protein
MDIRITDIDKAKSYNVKNNISRIFFVLSETPPAKWVRIFDALWVNHFYMSKRHAGIQGKYLYIDCVPNEIEKDHLPELNDNVRETNTRFTKWQQEQDEIRRRNEETDRRRRSEIDDIRNNIDFN